MCTPTMTPRIQTAVETESAVQAAGVAAGLMPDRLVWVLTVPPELEGEVADGALGAIFVVVGSDGTEERFFVHSVPDGPLRVSTLT